MPPVIQWRLPRQRRAWAPKCASRRKARFAGPRRWSLGDRGIRLFGNDLPANRIQSPQKRLPGALQRLAAFIPALDGESQKPKVRSFGAICRLSSSFSVATVVSPARYRSAR